MIATTLKTSRLVLRKPEAGDFPAYRAYCAGPRARFVGGPFDGVAAFNKFTAMIGHWDLRGFGRYVIHFGDAPVGHVGPLQLDDAEAPELTWTLWDEAATGQGLATEAVRAVADHLFAQGWGDLPIHIDPENAASLRLAARLGAVASDRPAPAYATGWRVLDLKAPATAPADPADIARPWEAAIPGNAAEFAATLRAQIPTFETANTRLRAPILEDFEQYREILMSPRAAFMDGPFAREEAWLDFTQVVANWLLRGHGPWTITDKATGAVLGFVLICMEEGDQEPELGWFLTEAAEGRSIAAEAATAAKAHGIKTLSLPSLVSYIDRVNTRSTGLATRIGGWADEVSSAALGEPGVVVYRHWPLPETDGGMEAYA